MAFGTIVNNSKLHDTSLKIKQQIIKSVQNSMPITRNVSPKQEVKEINLGNYERVSQKTHQTYKVVKHRTGEKIQNSPVAGSL